MAPPKRSILIGSNPKKTKRPQLPLNETTVKSRLFVNPSKSAHQKLNTIQCYNQGPIASQAQRIDSVLSLTKHCVRLYKAFSVQKEVEVEAVKQVFLSIRMEMKAIMDSSWTKIEEVAAELISYVNAEQLRLIQLRENHDEMLKRQLDTLSQVHIAKVMEETASMPLTDSDSAKSLHLSFSIQSLSSISDLQLSRNNNNSINILGFALLQFCQLLERIEETDYKSMVDTRIQNLRVVLRKRMPVFGRSSSEASFNQSDKKQESYHKPQRSVNHKMSQQLPNSSYCQTADGCVAVVTHRQNDLYSRLEAYRDIITTLVS